MSIQSLATHAAGRTLHLQALCAGPGRHTPFTTPDHTLLGHVRLSVTALSAPPAALAAVVLPGGGRDEYLLHPAAMDASMHAGVLTAAPDGLLRVPGEQAACARKGLVPEDVWIANCLDDYCAGGANALHAPRPAGLPTLHGWAAVSRGANSRQSGPARMTTHRLLSGKAFNGALIGLQTHVTQLAQRSSLQGMPAHAQSSCMAFTMVRD